MSVLIPMWLRIFFFLAHKFTTSVTVVLSPLRRALQKIERKNRETLIFAYPCRLRIQAEFIQAFRMPAKLQKLIAKVNSTLKVLSGIQTEKSDNRWKVFPSHRVITENVCWQCTVYAMRPLAPVGKYWKSVDFISTINLRVMFIDINSRCPLEWFDSTFIKTRTRA